MKRGKIRSAAGGLGCAGKPHPVVILSDDRFDATQTVTVCPFTTDPMPAPLVRLPVEPSAADGCGAACRSMVDRFTTVAESRPCAPIGRLEDEELPGLNRAVVVFLGLAGAGPARRRG